jgi:hypothetical protein
MSEFKAYLWAFKKHFGGWVGGVVMTTVVYLCSSVPHWLIWPWLILGLFVSAFFAWRDEYRKTIPRMTVSCNDEQCILPPRASGGDPLFRVIVNLGGAQLVSNVIATVKAIRKDGHSLPLPEPVRLRFHSGDSSGELKTMRPGASEPLDMLRLERDGKLWLALAWHYEAFERDCCNDPNHTYQIDVSVNSSVVPTKFTYVCLWTGDFNTTKPYIKQPSSVPNKAISQPPPT